MRELFSQFRELITPGRNVIITTHVNPDGDALGCEAALAASLAHEGKNVQILNHNGMPANYRFLSEIFPIGTYDPAEHRANILSADAIIVLDANALHRTGSLNDDIAASRAQKICIDHHGDPENFAVLCLIDEKVGAAGEIVQQLIASQYPDSMTAAIASALYVAIMTDTGSFRFSSTTAQTHRIVAELIAHGAHPATLYRKVFEEGSVARYKLLARGLDSLDLRHNGAVAAMTITQRDLQETGSEESDTDTMINQTLAIGGVRIGILFVELRDMIKIGLRSRDTIAVNELAKEFGGNGHRNAAGARVVGAALQDLRERVLARSSSYL
jgi:bifunctional oligoribonuclease and PAP phosphatase NrnA